MKLQSTKQTETLVNMAPPPITAELSVKLLLDKIISVPFKINKAPPYNPLLFINLEALICKPFA